MDSLFRGDVVKRVKLLRTDDVRHNSQSVTMPHRWRELPMSMSFISYRWSRMAARQRMGGLIAIGLLLTIAVAVFLARCTWPACGHLNLNTHTITAMDEYREFVSNEAAFKAFHRVAGVRLECSALRDDVVTDLQNGRLTLELGKPIVPRKHTAQPDHLHAWRQGRILHLMNTLLEREQEWEIWAAEIQEIVVSEKYDKRSFLPRLFGGLIIHVHHKQKPMVLFSDEPCP